MSRAIKVSTELAETAAQEAEVMSRSLTKQIEHWAILGRRLERSGMFSHRQVLSFLQGHLEFDNLTGLEQGVSAEALLEEFEEFGVIPEFAKELNEGIGYSGLDSSGRLVRRQG
jgi:ParD-like antitoxin of type II bacterial toxin-antitoxin system